MRNDEFKSLRARFYKSAMIFLQKGKSLAKRIFFSGMESAGEREPSETVSVDEEETVNEVAELESEIKKMEATEECGFVPEVVEDSKAARRYVDRFNKMKAAERNLQKAEDKYKSQLLEKLKDTNGRHVSKSTIYEYDVKIAKCYRRLEEAGRNLEIAQRKLDRDKRRYEETL